MWLGTHYVIPSQIKGGFKTFEDLFIKYLTGSINMSEILK